MIINTVISNEFRIDASAGSNGTISPTGTNYVLAGGSMSFTITANSGYVISDVLVDGVSQGAITSYTFSSVRDNHTISASFRASTTLTITASAGSNASISPSGTVSVLEGGSVTFAVSADYLYDYTVTLDGDVVYPDMYNNYTLTNVTRNHTISVTAAYVTRYAMVIPMDSATNTITFSSGMETESARNNMVKSHCTPCIVDDSGAIIHKLSWSDMEHDVETGESVDLYNSNVMAIWDTVWCKFQNGGTYWYFEFAFSKARIWSDWYSPMQYDANGVGWGAGMGVFLGTLKDDKLMSSLSSSTPLVSTTQNNMYNYAVNGRTGVFNQNFPPLVSFYLMMLLFVKGNKNCQSAYGMGYVGASGPVAISNYWASATAWNHLTGTEDHACVTALGIHSFWGNVFEYIGEMKTSGGNYYVGNMWSDHYNIETSGAPSTWDSTPAYNLANYCSSIGTLKSYYGIPTQASGSSSTYFCDFTQTSNSGEMGVAVGGTYAYTTNAGPFCFNAYNGTNAANSDVGGRLCVLIKEKY